jgi:hypothetical protein
VVLKGGGSDASRPVEGAAARCGDTAAWGEDINKFVIVVALEINGVFQSTRFSWSRRSDHEQADYAVHMDGYSP